MHVDVTFAVYSEQSEISVIRWKKRPAPPDREEHAMKKLQYNSPVILTFFLLSLGVLVLDWITGGWTTLYAFCVYRSSMADPLFYVRLLIC